MRKLIHWTARMLAFLTTTFAIHRGLSYAFLAEGNTTFTQTAANFLIGTLSDFWVAFLFSIFFALSATLASTLLGLQRASKWLYYLFFAAMLASITLHQTYVEYFSYPVALVHLEYLSDPQFIHANGIYITERALLLLVIVALMGWILGRTTMKSKWSAKGLTGSCLIVAMLALAAHSINLQYKFRWLVPENLSANFIENLYRQTINARKPALLTKDELNSLARNILRSDTLTSVSDLDGIVLARPPEDHDLHPLAPMIKQRVHKSIQSGQKPLVLIIVMESLRPAESGYQDWIRGDTVSPPPMERPSLTPHIDQLAKQAIVFNHAYATGDVTRGAQEAFLCGFPGSRDTSVMRRGLKIGIVCLSDLIKSSRSSEAKGTTFWLHGGDGRFDSQTNFWQQHQIDTILELKDFPNSAPRTGWGIGDYTLMQKSFDTISMLREAAPPYLLGMVLTVTNHIPWHLPGDFDTNTSDIVEQHNRPLHRSHVTTFYSDAALGAFIDKLRSSGIWEDSLIIVASDHGNSTPPFHDRYESSAARKYHLKAHINLLLVGGMIDSVLADWGQPNLVFNDHVSQVDVAPFLAYILGLPAEGFWGESLFIRDRRRPVLADLGQIVFYPSRNRVFTKFDLEARNANIENSDEKTALFYYRSILWNLRERMTRVKVNVH